VELVDDPKLMKKLLKRGNKGVSHHHHRQSHTIVERLT
jgi:hypothetical protein